MTPSRRCVRLFAGACVLSATVALVTACGGDDGGSAYQPPAGPAQATIRIEAGNFFFKPAEPEGPAGIDKVELVGKGGVHTLVIEKIADLKLRVDGDGERDTEKVRFTPGDYVFYCDIPGHRDAGMEGTIVIR